jgi:glycosyltransferase involved in cell wall biosynthesis
VTGEYPPTIGGVSDYTRNVAEGLAADGETVEVFAPRPVEQGEKSIDCNCLLVRWLPDQFSLRGLRSLRRCLNRAPSGGRLFVQYVPHAFGWKGMNILLCLWLARQRRHCLWIMFHEVAYPLEPGQRWRHSFLARVNQWMARQLLNSADRVFISTPAWLPLLEFLKGRKVEATWLPIFSNFEQFDGKNTYTHDTFNDSYHGIRLIGHFGTFGKHIRELLEAIVPSILEHCPNTRFLFIGRGSCRWTEHLENMVPGLRGRVMGTGELDAEGIIRYMRRCQLLVQPYPDGVNSRRSSLMCALALGCPLVTQAGPLTEPIWFESGATRLVASANPKEWVAATRRLLECPGEREELGRRAKALYWNRFSLRRTLDVLLSETPTNGCNTPRGAVLGDLIHQHYQLVSPPQSPPTS